MNSRLCAFPLKQRTKDNSTHQYLADQGIRTLEHIFILDEDEVFDNSLHSEVIAEFRAPKMSDGGEQLRDRRATVARRMLAVPWSQKEIEKGSCRRVLWWGHAVKRAPKHGDGPGKRRLQRGWENGWSPMRTRTQHPHTAQTYFTLCYSTPRALRPSSGLRNHRPLRGFCMCSHPFLSFLFFFFNSFISSAFPLLFSFPSPARPTFLILLCGKQHSCMAHQRTVQDAFPTRSFPMATTFTQRRIVRQVLAGPTSAEGLMNPCFHGMLEVSRCSSSGEELSPTSASSHVVPEFLSPMTV